MTTPNLNSPIDRLPEPTHTVSLLDHVALESSPIVANCRMNRERSLTGGNGYTRELGFNPLERLQARICESGFGSWLDLCCGSGAALIEASALLQQAGLQARAEITGVDLAGMFHRSAVPISCLTLTEASLTNWQPHRRYDVITCVHGLHYIGDKLELITKAVSWLADDGWFAANLGLENLRFVTERPAGRQIAAVLRKCGMKYNSRSRLLTCRGPKRLELPFQYAGASDEAGPNYTGQPAVGSYYT